MVSFEVIDEDDPASGDDIRNDSGDKLRLALERKEAGNESFKSKKYDAAAVQYMEGLHLLESVPEKEGAMAALALTTNLANCQYRRGDYQMSRELCNQVLKLPGGVDNVKALYRRAAASRALNDLNFALDDLRTILELDPKNAAAKKELAAVKKLFQKRKKEKMEKERMEKERAEKEKLEKERMEKEKMEETDSDEEDSEDEEEEKENAKEREKKKEKEERELAARRLRWTNEMARRKYTCDPPEEEIPFEEWDKQDREENDPEAREAREKETARREKKAREEQAKEREKKWKEERERAQENERRTKAFKIREALKKEAREVEKENQAAEDPKKDEQEGNELKKEKKGGKKVEENVVLTEKEIAELRPHSFMRKQTDDDKKLIGNINPKKLDAKPDNPQEVSLMYGWKEKDRSEWCQKRLKARLLDASVEYMSELEDLCYTAVVTKVVKVDGEASVAVSGGSKKYLYDLRGEIEYEVQDEYEKKLAEGIMRLTDIDSLTDEVVVQVPWWTKKPEEDKVKPKDNRSQNTWHRVADVTKARNLLKGEMRKCVGRFAEDFKKNF